MTLALRLLRLTLYVLLTNLYPRATPYLSRTFYKLPRRLPAASPDNDRNIPQE